VSNVQSAAQLAVILESTCTKIADEAADHSGFVAIRVLLQRFGAELVIRPLLVEGMLAKRSAAVPEKGHRQWLVLIDSVKWPFTQDAVAAESVERPLPERARFTIAHELTHSLAYRSTEFGTELQLAAAKNQTSNEFVEKVEDLTDGLVPLLLWPESRVEAFLQEPGFPLSIDRLVAIRHQQGISRPVMIYRLRRMIERRRGGAIEQPANRNVGIGIGEWQSASKAILRKKPTFVHFDQNILPEVFLRLRKEDRLPASSVFADKNFALCGGNALVTTFDCKSGVDEADSKLPMSVEVTVESGSRKPGATFFFCVRRVNKGDKPEPLRPLPPAQLQLDESSSGS
jgi:hypothetical protein